MTNWKTKYNKDKREQTSSDFAFNKNIKWYEEADRIVGAMRKSKVNGYA